MGQWHEKCVAHYDESVTEFFSLHFKEQSRNCLLIGGAGFDPRSAGLTKHLSTILGNRLTAYMIKEERQDPDPELVIRAANNLAQIKKYCSSLNIIDINIFASDGAVIGGHNIIRAVQKIDFAPYTDVVIDLSALSTGISYPVVSFIYQTAKKYTHDFNVHIALLSNPALDGSIKSEPNDQPSDVRGFDRKNLYGDNEKALLWLPVVSENKQHLLKIIHSNIEPHDTCPILPFPSEDPKKGDRIAYSIFSSIYTGWGGPLDNEWGLEAQNYLYADERKPLDIYRTILRIADDRAPVFDAFGGSTIILSPLGSKIPSIGALMAALEREFPVVYIETIAYNVDWSRVDSISSTESRMAHIWLYGDAYLHDK